MSRLFEALSDVAMYQPPPPDIPRAVASPDVIELGVHTDDVAPLLSAEQAETEHLSAAAAPVDVSVSEEESTSDVFTELAAEESETEQRSAENLPAEVAPFDLAPLLTPDQAETEALSPEASPTNAGMQELLLEAVPVDVPVSEEVSGCDVPPPLFAQEPETEQHLAENLPAEVTRLDQTPLLTAEQPETEPFSREAAPVDAERERQPREAVPVERFGSLEEPPGNVIPPASAEEPETEQHSAEVGPA